MTTIKTQDQISDSALRRFWSVPRNRNFVGAGRVASFDVTHPDVPFNRVGFRVRLVDGVLQFTTEGALINAVTGWDCNGEVLLTTARAADLVLSEVTFRWPGRGPWGIGA